MNTNSKIGVTNMYRIQTTIITFLVIISSLISVLAQELPTDGKSLNFKEIRRMQAQQFDAMGVNNGFITRDGKKEKAANWKLFKRWEYLWEQRVDPNSGEFPSTNSILELEKSKTLQKSNSVYNENWVNLGTTSSTGGYAGIGRINSVAFHPTDNNTFWVGSPSGGIWKTTNGGSSWTILNNSQSVLGVTDIAITSDYATSNTLYIATGDRDGGSMWSLGGGQAADNVSIGVLKSTNGGTTWNTTGLTYAASAGKLIYELVIHPTNNQILFAATSNGIYKTTDGGANWVQKNSNKFIDMEFKPGDPTIMYASTSAYSSSYVYRSTNSGESWTAVSTIASARRGELAVSANNPAVVYCVICNSTGGLKGIYKSTDSGASFSQVNTNTTENMLGYYSDGSGGTSGQGTYDLCIAASPTDVNTVFIGGVNTWKSTDGGVTWTANNMWTSYTGYNFNGAPEVHADKHALIYQNGTTLFEGNDGGIYKTTNGGTTWTDLTNGLVISQIYRIGISKTDNTKVLTGLQDNGSKKYNGGVSTWTDVYGGDGMECIIDFNNATSYMYVTYVNGEIYRSSNGFSTSSTTQISANITGGQPAGAWVTPYIMDPTNSAILYAGYDKVWKTTNRGNSGTWTAISQVLSSSNKLRSLAVAPSNTSVLYAADLSNMWKTTDGGATNWSTVTLPTTTSSVTYIGVKNTDANVLWLTYGGYVSGSKVYQSTNGGTSWTNISAGLPNLPVMSIVQYTRATDRNVLFAGTDVGVYVKDGNNDWVAFNNNLPNVVVSELEIFYGATTDKLRAGTFGRGLWETEISSALPVELTTFTARQSEATIQLRWQTASEVQNSGFAVERKLGENGEWEKLSFVPGSGYSSTTKEYSYIDKALLGDAKYYYRLKQIDLDGAHRYHKEIFVDFTSVKAFALLQNYPNPFNPSTKIRFSLPKEEFVTLEVFDLLGKKVAVLCNERKAAGMNEIEFNSAALSSGVYYYKLTMLDQSSTKKLIIMK